MNKIMKRFVVGIVGVLVLLILSRLAFEKQHGKFEMRASQYEAKTVLTLAYNQQKFFHAQHGEYTSSLKGLESQIPMGAVLRYKFGFANMINIDKPKRVKVLAAIPDFDSSKKDSDALGMKPRNEQAVEIPFNQLAEKYGCKVEKDKFKICAIGFPINSNNIDVWTIDDTKSLVNVKNAVE